MGKYQMLNLETENGNHIHLNNEVLKQYKDELLEFLNDEDYMKTLKFAKSVIMNQEIKSNNNIEGINDDLSIIDEIIKRKKSSLCLEDRKRIINLYKGYKYIFEHKNINKESLRQLYSILSDGILNEYDAKNMGDYYRNGPVYILKGICLTNDCFMGMDKDKIEYFMNQFFEFINSKDMEDSEIDIFIKSQVMHFYFVYIHPYFDVNGRTSRTVSMWYLLNNKNYPYVIFNRAISFAKSEYEKNIVKGRAYGDITLFLKYMLTSVEKELEKQYLIKQIIDKSGVNISSEENEMLEYLITIKGNTTVKDLAVMYNNYNMHQRPKVIFEEKILPLMDKSILVNKGYTKSFITSTMPNMNIGLNPDIIDVNPEKIKHLQIDRLIK